eukprot:gnl/Dysnectes_brevis/2107_a2444_2013.p1 GENE.gnl/Dysnectes_brevis/2107_a2444_2013~~gnl/Dysnectes_brevis/2107_a2444_2013.p1  ORF type:complete len:508 (+),score=96.26 gnl/Dysnectes_brevis/2107_a2444_2013:49-1572(+)
MISSLILILVLMLSVVRTERAWPNLLELSTRPWLYQLSLKYGQSITLSTIPDAELQSIRDQGIDTIYLLGVWKLGPYGLYHDQTDPGLLASYADTLPDYTNDDIIGSCFAVVSYTMNTDEIGTNSDLVTFRSRLNSMGMSLYIDFVPNHTAVDSDMMNDDPDYFVKCPEGWYQDPAQYLPDGTAFGKDKYGYVWTDTAQLNHWKEETILARIEELKLAASYADGLRVDMAMCLLNDVVQDTWGDIMSANGYSRPEQEFWSRAIQAVKAAYPNTMLMAEVYWGYGDTLHDLGFDYVYDKEGLYDTLSGGWLDSIRSYISSQGVSELGFGTHFVENHDEGRAVAKFGSSERANAAALVTFTLPGMRFHFQGQWVGKANKLDVHLRRSYDEPVIEATEDFYRKFLPLLDDPVWHLGVWTYCDVGGSDTDWRLMAWRYEYKSTRILVVVNYSDTSGSGSIILPNAYSQSGGDTIVVQDILNDQSYSRSASDMRSSGLYVIVDAWWAQIFKY